MITLRSLSLSLPRNTIYSIGLAKLKSQSRIIRMSKEIPGCANFKMKENESFLVTLSGEAVPVIFCFVLRQVELLDTISRIFILVLLTGG